MVSYMAKKLFTSSIKLCLISMSILLLISCSTSQSAYENTTPEFDLSTYFNGPLTARGYIKNHQNKVTRRFCVELEGTWQVKNDKNTGLLTCLLYTSPSPRDQRGSRMPSSA